MSRENQKYNKMISKCKCPLCWQKLSVEKYDGKWFLMCSKDYLHIPEHYLPSADDAVAEALEYYTFESIVGRKK